MAADVIYHHRCRSKFKTRKSERNVGRPEDPEDPAVMDSMSLIFALLEENAEECQFSATELLNILPG